MRELIELTCRPARARFSDYLDGVPQPLLNRLHVGLHLAVCPWCKATMRSLVATREALAALGELPPAPAPDDKR